jgi:hypothetical protein
MRKEEAPGLSFLPQSGELQYGAIFFFYLSFSKKGDGSYLLEPF